MTNAQQKNIDAIIEMLQAGQVSLTNQAHVLMQVQDGKPIGFTISGLLLRESNIAPSYIASKMINHGQVEDFSLHWLTEIKNRFGMDKSTLQILERVNDFSRYSERVASVCEALKRIAANNGIADFDPDALLVELNAADFDC